jgi:predicted secreted protein
MDSIVGMLALYFIIWWITLFAVLPLGIRGQWEGEVVPGTEPGAPQRPGLRRKILITSAISVVIFIVVMVIINTVTL